MQSRILLVAQVVLLLGAHVAFADPCGMVPPIAVGGADRNVALKRTGPQRTYVFYKDGIETVVIRPGYRGNVDQFGMLVPFPSPPSLRKVPDEIFAQIAAAVEPPEVVIDLRPQPDYPSVAGIPAPMATRAAVSATPGLRFDEVRVLRQEAVGMYEAAVLEAGSAAALKKWMTDHAFRFPDGMEAVCNDYVALGWCFVAVKTRVGDKGATDPKVGMKKNPDPTLPTGASFDGYIQGMGYRFETKELSVPMRLSTYNDAEDRRQIVYVLTEGPVKFDGVPDDVVKRQIPGKRLRANLTAPLPLRIYGGTLADVPPSTLTSLAARRDPAPHNGQAKDLFTSDLVAAKTKNLSLESEEIEKDLLDIGERLGMRGPDVDKLHTDELAKEREKTGIETLRRLDDLTLTVIDGELPFALMRDKNLTFSPFTLPAAPNAYLTYDAMLAGPRTDPGGVRVVEEAPLLPGESAKKKGWYETIWGN